MPIYEYACMECESHFDELVRSSDQAVTCPECGAAKVLKQLSSFAVVGAYYDQAVRSGELTGGPQKSTARLVARVAMVPTTVPANAAPKRAPALESSTSMGTSPCSQPSKKTAPKS